VFVYTTPGVLPVELVTYTVITQGVPRVTVPPVKEIVLAPVRLESVPAPHPLADAPVELLIVIPTGRASVIENKVKSVSAGALIVIANAEFAPINILVGVKVFVAEAPWPTGYTDTFALELPTFFGPSAVVKSPGAMVFV
jgi:hypothetical protein